MAAFFCLMCALWGNPGGYEAELIACGSGRLVSASFLLRCRLFFRFGGIYYPKSPLLGRRRSLLKILEGASELLLHGVEDGIGGLLRGESHGRELEDRDEQKWKKARLAETNHGTVFQIANIRSAAGPTFAGTGYLNRSRRRREVISDAPWLEDSESHLPTLFRKERERRMGHPLAWKLGQVPGSRPSRRLLILGIDDQAAAHAFTFAFGVQVGFVAQGEVDDAALAR